MEIDARAVQLAAASDLVDVPKLLTAYYEDWPDPRIPAQQVVFGTSATFVAMALREGMPEKETSPPLPP